MPWRSSSSPFPQPRFYQNVLGGDDHPHFRLRLHGEVWNAFGLRDLLQLRRLHPHQKRSTHRVRRRDLLLAIDDLSMGQTTLYYLRENLFDVIKIDGSLVKGLSNSQIDTRSSHPSSSSPIDSPSTS
ncbi:MAG: EAL domain-containing protein [Bacilli bacterium]|nr:EAL domain-containing protein [Bacilli bacterium]